MDAILRDLIAIPSITGDAAASQQIIDYATHFLQKRGMHVHTFNKAGFPSLVATSRATKHPKVLLAAHLDVVAAPPEMFQLRLENGTYYGRGVWDMKYAAAAYLHLIDEIQATLHTYDIGIMFTSDEEIYGEYGTGYQMREYGLRPQVAILPDAIQPWHIQQTGKGCYFGEVSVIGISAHGSRPWEGDSASIKLIHILQQVADLFKNDQQAHTKTLNISMLPITSAAPALVSRV